MKAILKLLILFIIPILGFSQEGNRFTDKFGPFHITYDRENDFAKRKAVPYPFVRDADVMWSKVTWEVIDLREKMNQPLYYPTDIINGRKSLIMALLDGLKDNYFIAFRPPNKNNAFEFVNDTASVLSYQKVKDLGKIAHKVEKLGSGSTSTLMPDTYIETWKFDEIVQILVKEIWYFDKKTSQLNNEIIGLCLRREYNPIIKVTDETGVQRDTTSITVDLFWVYYPDAREYLATIPVYNPNNDTELYSFDDLFVNRKFKSFFIREANVYNDRLITDYVSGHDAQLESERIKKEIFDYEQDLWEN